MPATAGITVIPGGYHVTITPAGTFRLGEAGRGGGDALLASAALAVAPRAVIAVVLSGMLQDGADGVRAVKRHGGRVIAQDPATARAPGMPASAIATGCADFVLPPDRIPYALITLAMAPGGAELFSVPLPHWAKIGA
jgi:two-component system chemotaxis response regulator CheB